MTSFNTTDGQPPMSLVGGGDNVIPQGTGTVQQPQVSTITVPNAILQHPAVQAGVQKAQQDMARAASAMPKADSVDPFSSFQAFHAKYPGATQQAYNQISNTRAFRDSGDFSPLGSMNNHPILGGIANAMMAFGQGITKQPFLTDFQQNQTQRMQQMAEMARYGQLTPEQQMMMGLRVQGLNDREQSIKNTQAQRDQTNWTQLINKYNPSTASSRSTLGMTANGNVRANRALATIQNNSVMTYQDLGNVIGDLAGIYQGGAPTDMGMKHQQYDSIQTRIANMQQFLTGQPQDAVPTAIKQKIVDTINSLKSVNNSALKNTLDSVEKGQNNLISKHPDEWKLFRQSVESDYMNSGNPQQGGLSSGSPQASTSNIPTFDAAKEARYQAWKAKQK